MKKLIKVGSDCSGVGAFPQALIRLGINFKEDFACDFDYYARQTYLLNFGTAEDIELSKSKEHKKYADGVQKIALSDKEQTEKDIVFLKEANEFAKKFSFYYPFNMYEREIPNNPLDVYMGSFPCQSFSLAGNRKGEASKKGILFYNGHEFIKKNNPRFFIFENVKGLLSDDSGKTFQKWIDYLGGKTVNGNPVIFPHEESVPYHVYYQVMNAKHYGVPQNRERIFIIGIRDDADNDFSFPKPFPLEKRLKDVLESEVDEKYFLSDKMIEYLVKHQDGRAQPFASGEETHANCLTAVYHKMPTDGQYLKIGAIRGRNPTNPLSRVSGLPTEQMLEINENGTSNALTTVQKDNVVVIKFERTESAKQKRKESLSKTGKDTGSFSDRQMIGVQQDFSDTILANANPQKEGLIIIPANNSKGYEIAEEEEEDSINFSVPSSTTRRGRVGKKVSQTLDTQCNQGIATKQLSKQQLEKLQNLEVDENIAGCITNAIGRAGSSDEYIASVKRNAIITQRIRRLVPLECFKLMDFNFDITGVKDFKWEVSDSQAYKQAGNSIVVNCLVELLKKLNL